MTIPYTLADYLLDRLAELGVDRIFGVPGDFTLGTLDHIQRHPTIDWIGCANELGAAYAADGYARMRGIGVLCTTFGVGELSAINAIAGSFAEHVPVVHIVGAPSRAAHAAHQRTHHTLGTGDFDVFSRMTSAVVCAQASLGSVDPRTEIDSVLERVVMHRRPGYLQLPADLAELPVVRPMAPLRAMSRMTDATALQRFQRAASLLIEAAQSAALLADVYVQRMGAESNLHRLIQATSVPHATLLWGRRVVDESHPLYLGIYNGAASARAVREQIESADVLITAGVALTDLTSGFFSQQFAAQRLIDVGPRSASVQGITFEPVDMADALDSLSDILHGVTKFRKTSAAENDLSEHVATPEHEPLSQKVLWQEIAQALRPGDLIVADQGTAFYGMGAHRLPPDTIFIGQPLWASIGFALPALLGAAIASPLRRPILLVGDGAAQLTIAELGTMLRNGINAIVVIVNNDGYTVERAIHGKYESYNDIAQWDWTALPRTLGKFVESYAVRVVQVGQFREALNTARACEEQLSLIEVVVPRFDVPPLLSSLAQAAAQMNRSVG